MAAILMGNDAKVIGSGQIAMERHFVLVQDEN